MGIGAFDNIDSLFVKKYSEQKLFIKSNYDNCQMKKTNYLPKNIEKVEDYCHPCEINYDDIKKKFQEYRREYKILRKHPKINRKRIEQLNQKMRDLANPNKMYERLGVDTIALIVGYDLFSIVDPNYEDNLLVHLAILRTKMTDKLGYIIPNIRIMDTSNIEPYEYQIYIENRLVFRELLNMNDAGNKNVEQIIQNLQKICIKYAPQIMYKSTVIKLMELVRSQDPTLVNDLVPVLLSPVDIKHILVKLIQEQISIKNIVYIFELLNDYARYTNDVDILTEQLKQDLQF